MGLLLSVLIGCVGVLELLTCLKHATNGVPFYIEHSTPCLFYHHSDSVNCSSYDCICNISSFSQTSFPTSVKYKLENLHEYSLRVRNDIRSLGERYAGTLSDCSTKDLLRVSRSDSRHSDDFEAEMSGNLGVEETSDAQSESGFRIWDSIFLPSEFNSNLRMSSLKSFRSIDSNIRSCSLNEDVKELSFNVFEHQDLTNLSLDMHYVKESENSIESMDYDEKDIFENFNKINLFSKTDGVLQNENEQMISKSFARHHSITGEAKKDRHKEGATFGESIKTTNDLLRSKYFNTTKNLSPEKKRFVSVQVQTNLEEICPNGDTSYCLKDSFSDAQNERTINLISKLKSKKEHHSMLLSPSETNSVNRGPTETSAFLDSENCDKKTTNKSIKKTTNDDVNLSLKDKVFNSGQSFEEYVDAEDEQITILEYQVNAPIKYAVPDAGEKNAFWLIFSDEYTKAMNKDWHSGHFCCWQCDESLTGQRYVLRDEHPYCIKCYESVFANGCEECNKIIGIDSKDLSYKDKHWHEACFLCNKCRVSLVDKQFGSKIDKIYCGNCYDAQFASRCDGCGEIFRAGTKKMEYKTRQWHEKCFCCVVCKNPIGTKSFIPREQEIYCAGCYEDKFATRCVKCNKIITAGGVTYKNEPWHRDCFTCSHCNNSLAGQRFTSRDEKPYCAECFGELFAKRCTACSKPITGIGGTRFISFEDRHWHNDCFICAGCNTSLVGRGFITDADDIICPECAKQKLM